MWGGIGNLMARVLRSPSKDMAAVLMGRASDPELRGKVECWEGPQANIEV